MLFKDMFYELPKFQEYKLGRRRIFIANQGLVKPLYQAREYSNKHLFVCVYLDD